MRFAGDHSQKHGLFSAGQSERPRTCVSEREAARAAPAAASPGRASHIQEASRRPARAPAACGGCKATP
eukprot:2304664-Alexandrium_andersonii.AAC.1